MRPPDATNKQRKAMIQNGFDTVAEGYDHPSLSFFPETAKRLVEHLQLNPTDKLLDVCTGTGVVALTAAEKLTKGKVTGIDLSSGMLQQATNKAEQLGLLSTTAKDGGSAGNAGAIASKGGKVAITTFAGEAFSPMADIFFKQYQATGREIPPPVMETPGNRRTDKRTIQSRRDNKS